MKVRRFSGSRRNDSRLAVAREEHDEIALGVRAVALDVDAQVGDHVAQLRPALAIAREALREGTYGGVSLVHAGHGARERAVRSEAVDERVDVALVERADVANEEVVDPEAILDTGLSHPVSLSR